MMGERKMFSNLFQKCLKNKFFNFLRAYICICIIFARFVTLILIFSNMNFT